MDQDASGDSDIAYLYKSSLASAASEFRLRTDALEWRVGRRAGRVSYSAIRRVRLSFKPASMQGHRFVTELWSADAPKLAIASTSWRGLFEQATQDAAYGVFVRELHRRLAAAGSAAAFDAGTPPMLYWPGLVVFVTAAVAIVLLTGYALLVGAFAQAAIMGGLAALLVWQSGTYFRRNFPARYCPDALPARLLPGSRP